MVSLLKFYLENGQHYQELSGIQQFNNPSTVLVFPQGYYSECQIKGIVWKTPIFPSFVAM